MANRAFPAISLLLLALLSSCGEFTLSPYMAQTKERQLNAKNLAAIKRLESEVGDTFTIAAIADIQNAIREFKDQVEYINRHKDKYAFVIVGGDLTDFGLLGEFEMVRKNLNKLKVPYVAAVGNHDLLANGGEIFDAMFGPTDFSFTFRQTKFIVFNNNNWESAGKVPDLGFVESELAASTSQFNVLVAHVPPSDGARWNREEMDDMRALVDSYNVDYFLNGHVHPPATAKFGNATQVTIGSSDNGKILNLTISNDDIKHEHVSF